MSTSSRNRILLCRKPWNHQFLFMLINLSRFNHFLSIPSCHFITSWSIRSLPWQGRTGPRIACRGIFAQEPGSRGLSSHHTKQTVPLSFLCSSAALFCFLFSPYQQYRVVVRRLPGQRNGSLYQFRVLKALSSTKACVESIHRPSIH